MVYQSEAQKIDRARRVKNCRRLWAQGFTEVEISKLLGVVRGTVRLYKKEIKAKIVEQIFDGDEVEILTDLLSQIKTVQEEYWQVYVNSKSEVAKVSALNGQMKAIEKTAKIFQSLGLIYRKPDEVVIQGIPIDAGVFSEALAHEKKVISGLLTE